MESNPFVGVNFETERGFVVVEWFDGIETKSKIVSLRDNNPFARITELTNNGVRAILNEMDAKKKAPR